MSQRQETFFVFNPTTQRAETLDRNEALRVLIAATYRTAKVHRHFCTDDVFARVTEFDQYQLRRALAGSKLIAVALRKAAKAGICAFGGGSTPGGPVCNSRRKGVWVSKISPPVSTVPLV